MRVRSSWFPWSTSEERKRREMWQEIEGQDKEGKERYHRRAFSEVVVIEQHWGTCVRDGICVGPPLCRKTSQGKYGSSTIDLVYVGETVGKIGEVNEMGERTCACGQCQVRQRMRHDTWMRVVLGTQRCAILYLEPRVFA